MDTARSEPLPKLPGMTKPDVDPVLADLDPTLLEVVEEMAQAPRDLAERGLLKPSQAEFAAGMTRDTMKFLVNRLREKGYRLTVSPLE